MLIFLLFFPLLIGGSVFILPEQKSRKRMLIFAALLHSACVFSFWKFRPATSLNGFLGLDALGLLVLSVISVLFLMVSFYLMGYFKNESDLSRRDFYRIFIIFSFFHDPGHFKPAFWAFIDRHRSHDFIQRSLDQFCKNQAEH